MQYAIPEVSRRVILIMKKVTILYKSGNTVEIPIKTEFTPTSFRQFLAILQTKDTCITDTTFTDNFYCINMDSIDCIYYGEAKEKKSLKESK